MPRQGLRSDASHWLNPGHGAARGVCVMEEKRLTAAAMLLAFAGIYNACGGKEQAPSAPPEVQVVEVVQKDVPITKEWVATLNGLVNAQIHAQVTGILLKQNYTNGAYVKTGTPLFQIDPRPFQAALDQAKGNLEQAKANLLQTQARLGKTEMDVARYTPLAKESAISQQELDDAIQANLAAKAQVEQSKAAIESSQAALENARINLSFTRIVSPIDGVAAIATAQVGDYVGPQSGALTTVSTINPILVNFTASEPEYLNAMKFARNVGMSEDAALRALNWQLKLADGTIYPDKGKFYALDRQLDVRTGAILVQVAFPNPGNILRPGGFGGISTVIRMQQGALLVPQRAVSELQGGYLMAVIGADNKVTIRPVKVGPRIGTDWIIDEGLKPGDRVVAEGVQKVRDGMPVNPKPFQPAAAAEGTKKAGEAAK
jgi:membrane fusion protein (multidrug efflux system)